MDLDRYKILDEVRVILDEQLKALNKYWEPPVYIRWKSLDEMSDEYNEWALDLEEDVNNAVIQFARNRSWGYLSDMGKYLLVNRLKEAWNILDVISYGFDDDTPAFVPALKSIDEWLLLLLNGTQFSGTPSEICDMICRIPRYLRSGKHYECDEPEYYQN